MTPRDDPIGQVRAPLHLWIIGGLGVLWNAWRCYYYLMINVRDADTIAVLPAGVIDYLDALPGWVIIAWAMVVGFAMLGSLLLLCRSLAAAYAFALSVVLLAAIQAYPLVAGLPRGLSTPVLISTIVAVWLTGLAQLFYSLRMRANRVLR